MARYGTVKRQMKDLNATASQQPEEIRERRTTAEDTAAQLEADIGKPGTYDLPTGPIAEVPPPPEEAPPTGLLSKDGYKFADLGSVKNYDKLIKQGYSPEEAAHQGGVTARKSVDPNGIFKETETNLGIGSTGGKGGTSTISLDKDKALAKYKSSSAFRQVSRMMAESEQMLARSGPLWDEMIRSQQLPILEGSATMARENTENIRRALQRGGAARRDGFAAIARIRAQEASNATRGQAIAKAHTEMDRWARENAGNVINFAHGWATNQAGIRESYQTAMDNATQLMATSSLPFIFTASQKEQEYRDAKSAQSRGKVMKHITGALAVVGSLVSMYRGDGGGAAALLESANSVTRGQAIGSTTFQNSSGKDITNTAEVSYDEAPPQRTLGGDIKSMASSAGKYLFGGG